MKIIIENKPVPYDTALIRMKIHVDQMVAGMAESFIWIIEHPPLYTKGTSAKDSDLLSPTLPVYEAGRGGQYTYHGPGQIVVYCMINLKDHALDIRSYIKMLEEWIINVLRHFGVKGERRCERVGVWVVQPESGTEEKIAAIGVRISRGITYHGFSLNVNPNLNHYAGIVPCGLSDSDYGITSLSKLGLEISLRDVVHTIVALSPFKKLSTAEK